MLESYTLKNDSDWLQLANRISPNAKSHALENIIRHLRALGAVFAICEQDYLDRDFSAEFSTFYSRLFRRYTKSCARFHFFSSEPFVINSVDQLASEMTKLFGNHYLGFFVVRPISHAPIGRTLLAPPKSDSIEKVSLLVRSDFEAHYLGATGKLSCAPFVQQDSRVGACAQAAIWMAGRHFHQKHRGPWMSVDEITAEASKPSDVNLSFQLPQGSSFLTGDQMVRALRAMGREPFTYASAAHQNLGPVSWPNNLRPKDVIRRYIDSGIPVILGFGPLPGEAVGHAVLAVGHSIKALAPDTPLPKYPTRAEFVDSILVNDDQRGPYVKIGLEQPHPDGLSPYSIDQHLRYLIVPLPSRVYVPAEVAERVAWDHIENLVTNAILVLKNAKVNVDKSVHLAEEIQSALTSNKLIARTYLTYGWKYRQRILTNNCDDIVKYHALTLKLPRYVWVTEFGTFDDLNNLNSSNRKICAHVVIDATSNVTSENAVFVHSPGIIAIREFVDPRPLDTPSPKMNFHIVTQDQKYAPKVRGT